MSTHLKKNKHYIYVLRDGDEKVRRVILKHADESLILALSECAYNLLNNVQPLSEHCIEKLKPYKHIIRKLADPEGSVEKKRLLLNTRRYSGGFLSVLLSTLLPVLASSVLSKILKK